jgi:hypothetical protein
MLALSSGQFWCRAARWAARVTAALLVLLVAAFVIGEGLPDPRRLSAAEAGQLVALLTMVLGLLAGFRWEVLGGAAVLTALAAFYLINVAKVGKIPGGAFPLFAVPGLLYLISAALRRRDLQTPVATG